MVLKKIWEIILNIFSFLKEVFYQWQKDKAMEMGAAISYYTVFSLPPILIILITLTGWFFGQDAMEGKIVNQIKGIVGENVAVIIQTMIQNTHRPDITSYSAVMGIIALLIGATGVFSQLKVSLNRIWGVEAKAETGFFFFIKDKIIPFLMILAMGFLIFVSVVIDTLVTNFNTLIGRMINGEMYLFFLKVSSFNLSFFLITLMFALMYKILPDVNISLRDVALGSIVTAILFTLGKYIITIYLINTNVGLSYGAAGSMIVLMVWVFYASLIFLFGGEFTQIYTRKYGKRIIAINEAKIVNPERFKENKNDNI